MENLLIANRGKQNRRNVLPAEKSNPGIQNADVFEQARQKFQPFESRPVFPQCDFTGDSRLQVLGSHEVELLVCGSLKIRESVQAIDLNLVSHYFAVLPAPSITLLAR